MGESLSQAGSKTGSGGRKNAAEALFDRLRAAIIAGALPEGMRLPAEAQLAREHGVSRPVVREALRSLQTLGFTRTRTGSGTFVVNAAPGPDLSYGRFSARDLNEARRCIEIPAAGWAALRRTPSQSCALLELCDAMERPSDAHRWVLLDSQFHRAVAQASGNAVFARIVAETRQALTWQSELVNLMAHRRDASNAEHRRIAVAIATGESQAACAAMEVHLDAVRQAVAAIGDDLTAS